MKKLTQLFMSLVLFLGVGTAFADVIPPTFNPASGSTVEPGQEIKVSIDQTYANADYKILVWTFDASAVSSLDNLNFPGDMNDLQDGEFPSLTLSMGMGVSMGVEGDVEGVEISRWWPNGPMVPDNAQGNITMYYRFVIGNGNNFQSTSTSTANYTVEGEVKEIPLPVFSPAQGPVEKDAKITLTAEAGEGAFSHYIAYVINNANIDFTQYTGSQESGEDTKLPYSMQYPTTGASPIVIDETKTVTAAVYKYNEVTGDIIGWSEKVTVTYTIAGGEDPEPTPETITPPTFSPAAGAVTAGTQVTISGGSQGQSTSYYIAYVIDNEDFDFTQYMGSNDVPYSMMYTDPITINTAKTITAAIYKYDEIEEEVLGWSEKVSAAYTVTQPETPGNEIPVPTFSQASGTVDKGTTVTVAREAPDDNYTYTVYRVLNNEDFDFSQYLGDDQIVKKAGASYVASYKVFSNTTITAATAKINYDDKIVAWSEKVSATYTVEDPIQVPAPVFANNGVVAEGGKVLLTNGTEGDETPLLIYYNTRNTHSEEFDKVTKTDQLTNALKPGLAGTSSKITLYPAEGISITQPTTINAATARIEGDDVIWSPVVIKDCTIGEAPTPEKPAAPTFTPDGGDLQRGTAIKLTNPNNKGDIIYSFSSSDNVFTSITTSEALGRADGSSVFEYRSEGILIEEDKTIKAAVVFYNEDETLTWSDVVTKSFTLVGEAPKTVATPVITPATDSYVHIGDTVKITCATEGALLYYTSDGSVPYTTDARGEEYTGVSDNAILYTGPFALTSDMLIKQNTVWALKIRAVAQNGNAIKVAGVGYNVLPNTPTFSIPTGSEVREGREVAIACVPTQADIYYTTDGSTPTMENSPKYTGPIAITSAMTINARAVLGQYQSGVVSASYTLKTEADPDEVILSFNPASGTEVDENKAIAITANKEDVDIFYMMFSSAAEAYAAAWDQEAAELYSTEMRPVVSTEKNTIKAAYARQGADAIGEEFFYATYTVKTLPPVTLTFDPASGAEVEEGTEITVTASRETEIFYNVYPDRLAADTDELFMVNAMEVSEDGMPVITAAKPYLRCGVYEKGQMKYFSASYTVIFSIRFNPASGAEVEEGTAISIIAPGNVDLFYMMYESEEAAKAAEWNQEEAELYSAEMKPVVSTEKNTVKVAYALEGAEALADTFFYATYKVTAPADITLTFDPASGAEVEEGTEITVTASRETEIFYNVYADSAAAKADTTFIVTSKEVAEDGKPVITKGNTYLLCAVYDKGEMKYFAASYTIKEESANEGLELQGVSIYPNPSDGRFVIELPVDATVEVFAASGALIRNFTATAGKTTLNIGQSGIYFVRIAGEGRSTVKRVIVR